MGLIKLPKKRKKTGLSIQKYSQRAEQQSLEVFAGEFICLFVFEEVHWVCICYQELKAKRHGMNKKLQINFSRKYIFSSIEIREKLNIEKKRFCFFLNYNSRKWQHNVHFYVFLVDKKKFGFFVFGSMHG